MQMISPDVLAQARGLSPLFSGLGIGSGLLLWLCGWRWHRFWVVLAVTLVGGLVGLQTGKVSNGHILAMGILLAMSAGLLALELARLFVFLAAGMAVWLAADAIFPRGQELWVAFLIGGLLGIFLYRFWTMVLTSFAAVLLGTHSLLCLLDYCFKFDAVAFARSNALILNGGVLAATLLGLGLQGLHERWYLRRLKRRKKAEEEKKRDKILASAPKPNHGSLWGRLLGGKKKAA